VTSRVLRPSRALLVGALAALVAVAGSQAANAQSPTQISISGPSSAVSMGERTEWTVSARAVGGPAPSGGQLDVTVSGLENPRVNDVQAPPGWSVTTTSNGFRISAPRVPSPATGSISTVPAPPAPATTRATTTTAPPPAQAWYTLPGTRFGGTPVMANGRIYVAQTGPVITWMTTVTTGTSLLCVEVSSGASCGAHALPDPAGELFGRPAVYGNELWLRFNSDAQLYLRCFDTTTNTWCANPIVLAPRARYVNGRRLERSASPVVINKKLYVVADDHRIYCVDPVTKSPCVGYPKSTVLTGVAPTIPERATGGLLNGLGAETGLIDVHVQGTQIFASLDTQLTAAPGTSYLHCFDTKTGGPCTGWTQPRTLTIDPSADTFGVAVFPATVNDSSSGGAVCLGTASRASCTSTDGKTTRVTNTLSGLWGLSRGEALPFAAFDDASDNERVYHPGGIKAGGGVSAGGGKATCWRWNRWAGTWCTSAFAGSAVSLTGTRGGTYTGTTGLTRIGNCIYATAVAYNLNDYTRSTAFVFGYDLGGSGCTKPTVTTTSPPTTAPPRPTPVRHSVAVDIPSFTCGRAQPGTSWNRFRLTPAPTSTTFSAATVTFVDTTTGRTVRGPVDLLGANGVVELGGVAGIAATVTSLRADVTLTPASVGAWPTTEVSAELTFNGRLHTCFPATVITDCDMNPLDVRVTASTPEPNAAMASTAATVLRPASCDPPPSSTASSIVGRPA
jgi:hypothetical protein